MVKQIDVEKLSDDTDCTFLPRKGVIVPDSLWKEMLHRIHSSHLGIVKCKSMVRDDSLYSICAVNNKIITRNLLWRLKLHPGLDRLHQLICLIFKGHSYFLCVDRFSKWSETWKSYKWEQSINLSRWTKIYICHQVITRPYLLKRKPKKTISETTKAKHRVWLIDYIVFYAVSAIFRIYNGVVKKERKLKGTKVLKNSTGMNIL